MNVKSVKFSNKKRMFTAIIALIFIVLIIPIKDVVSFKEDVSGYKIDVTYQDNKAILSGNATEVDPAITLNKIVDKDNQELDANNLSVEVTENGKYRYWLYYSLTQNEVTIEKVQTITVVVDKIPGLEPVVEESDKRQKNGSSEVSEDLLDISPEVLKEQDGQTIIDPKELGFDSVEELFASARSGVSTFASETVAVYPYARETYGQAVVYPLKGTASNPQTINVPLGNVSENTAAYTSAIKAVSGQSNREYGSGAMTTIYRSDGSQIEIAGIYKGTVNNVQKTFYSIKNSSGGVEPVGYMLSDTDKIRVYYTLGNNTRTLKYTINGAATTPSGYTVNITPTTNQSGTAVRVGTVVIVEYKWPGTRQNANVSISSSPGRTDITAIDQVNRTYSFYFIMPDQDSTIQFTDSQRSGNKWFGVYDNNSTYFNFYELGFNKISTTSGEGASVGIQKLPADSNRDNFYADYDTIDYSGGYAKINGYMSNAGGTQIQYPVVNYTPSTNTVLNAKIEVFRGVRSGLAANYPTNWDYELHPISYLDVFTGGYNVNNPNDSATQSYMKGFTRYPIQLYQTQENYNKQKQTESTRLSDGWQGNYIWTNSTGAQQNGVKLYPVVTNLPNGIKVTAWPQTYDKNRAINSFPSDSGQPGNYGIWNSTPLTYITVNIYIEYAYDDIRLSYNIASTANAWYTMSQIDGVDVKSNGAYNGTIDNAELGVQTYVNVNSATSGIHTITLKPRLGYSAPTAMMYNRSGGAMATKIYPDKTQANSSGEGNPFYINGTFYNSNTGMYTFYFDHKGSHLPYSIQIVCERLTFSYSFQDLTGVEASGSNYSVDKRYFTVPTTIPSVSSGQYFRGWTIEVALSNGSKVTINNNGNYYKPRDLIDVLDIYTRMVNSAGANVQGSTSFTLKFVPVTTADPNQSLITTANYNVNIENNGYGTYSTQQNSTNVVKNEYAQLVGYGNTRVINGVEYKLASNSKTGSTVTASGQTFADVYYNKAYAVEYTNGGDNGVSLTGSPPTDSGKYTSNMHNGQLSSTLTISTNGSLQAPSGYSFDGWYIKGDTSKTLYKGGNSPSSIDLTAINQGAKNTIFSEGKITFIPVITRTVSKVTDDGGTSTTNRETTSDIISNPKDDNGTKYFHFSVSADFRYGQTITDEQLKTLVDSSNPLIKIAIYRQNPGGQWVFFGDNSGIQFDNYGQGNNYESDLDETQQGTQSIKVTRKGTDSFTVTFGIKDTDLEWNRDAKFRIVAWTDANKEGLTNNAAGMTNVNAAVGSTVSASTISINPIHKVVSTTQTGTTGSGTSTDPIVIDAVRALDSIGANFNVSAEFTYNVNDGSGVLSDAVFNSALTKSNSSNINVALYRKKGTTGSWVKFGDNTGVTTETSRPDGVTLNDSILFSRDGNNIKITYRLKDSDLEWNHNDVQFMIVAWTDANGIDISHDNASGKDTAVSVYSKINVIHSITNSTGTIINEPNKQTIYDGTASKTITVDAVFKYDIKATSDTNVNANNSIFNSRIKELLSSGKLKVGLYKQNDTGWTLLKANGQTVSANGYSISDATLVEDGFNATNKTFTISYTITPDNISDEYGSVFRIVAWTDSNGTYDYNNANNNVPSNNTPEEGKNIPAVTSTLYVVYKVTNTDGVNLHVSENLPVYNSAEYEKGTSFVVTHSFKYDIVSSSSNSNTDNTAFGNTIQDLFDNKILKIALYKQDSGETDQWTIWADNNGGRDGGADRADGSKRVESIEFNNFNATNKTFDISITINPDNISGNDLAKFKIFIWTDANGLFTADNLITNDTANTSVPTYTNIIDVIEKIKLVDGTISSVESELSYDEGKYYTVTADFKYGITSGKSGSISLDRLEDLTQNGHIKFALYKQNPSNSTNLNWSTWDTPLTVRTKVSEPVITIKNESERTFTVSYTLTGDVDLSEELNNGAKYKVIAWTDANGKFTPPVGNDDTGVTEGVISAAIGSTVPTNTRVMMINRNFNPISHNSTADPTKEQIEYINSGGSTVTKIFNGSNLDSNNLSLSLIKQGFDFDVELSKSNGISISEKTAKLVSSNDLVVKDNWTSQGSNSNAYQTTVPGAKMIFKIPGSSHRIKVEAPKTTYKGKIDIYIDGVLVAREIKVENTNNIVYTSGYIGEKTEDHTIEIVSSPTNGTNPVVITSVIYTTGYEYQLPNAQQKVNFNYSVSSSDTSSININLVNSTTQIEQNNLKFVVKAWNDKNVDSAGIIQKVSSTATTLLVIDKVTDLSGNYGNTKIDLDTVRSSSSFSLKAQFTYGSSTITQDELSKLLSLGEIKAAVFKKSPSTVIDGSNNMELWAYYDKTTIKDTEYENRIGDIAITVDDNNKINVTVPIKNEVINGKGSISMENDHKANYVIYLWTDSNTTTEIIPDFNDENVFITSADTKIPTTTVETLFVRQVKTTAYQVDGETKSAQSINVGGDFTLKASFNYDVINLVQEDINYLLDNDYLKVAIYKKNPDGSSSYPDLWELWAKKSGNTNTNLNSNVGDIIITKSATTNNTIDVTVTIKNINNSVSEEWDNGAKYRIYLWVEHANGNVSSSYNIPQFMTYVENPNSPPSEVSGHPLETVCFTNIPKHTFTISTTNIVDVIKYPKQIVLFKQSNGDVDSGTQLITLNRLSSNGTQLKPSDVPNDTYEVSVVNPQIEMKYGNKIAFNTHVYNSSGKKLESPNLTLGKLNYKDVINNPSTSGSYSDKSYIKFSLKTTSSELQNSNVKLDGLPELNGTLNFTFARTTSTSSN